MKTERRGFTLIEILIASGLSVVVIGELLFVMTGLFRIGKVRMVDSELTSKLRFFRERILFQTPLQVSPASSGTAYFGGLLSATNHAWSSPQISAAIQYATEAGEFGTVVSDDGRDALAARLSISSVDDGVMEVIDQSESNVLFVTTSVTIDGSNRTERIALPVFGRQDDSLTLPDALSGYMEIREDPKYLP